MSLTRINGDLIDDNSIPASKLSFDAGDMTKAVYDVDDDGKVGIAEVAEAVDWDGVQNKPSQFPSDETLVTVDASRFENIVPADDVLSDTLTALDAAAWRVLAPVTIPDNESTGIDITLGAAADVGAGKIIYQAVRGTEFEVGELRFLRSRSGSTVWIDWGPFLYNGDVLTAGKTDVGLTFEGTQSGGDVILRVKSDNRADDATLTVKYQVFAP